MNRTHSAISTYLRSFQAESAMQTNKTRVLLKCFATTTSDITDGGTSSWKTSSVLETNGEHMEKCKFTAKSGTENIQTVRFWYKNANTLVISTLRSRAMLTNHGLRRCPWDVNGWLGRGGRGRSSSVNYNDCNRAYELRHIRRKN